MFRKLIKYIPILLPALLAAGCTDTLDAPDSPDITGEAGMLTVTLTNGQGSTRANDDAFNEAKITNAVVALYPNTGGETTAAVEMRVFGGLDATKQTKVQMSLTDEMIDNLFYSTSGNKCRMYVLVNVDNPEAIPEKPTITELKSLQASSTFDKIDVQPCFIMAGEGTVTYTKNGSVESAAGAATVNRAAAKIRLNIWLPDKYVDKDGDGATWIPMTNGSITAMLDNGVKTAVAAPGIDGWKPDTDDAYFSITSADTDVIRTLSAQPVATDYPYQLDVPFYTYPNKWEATPEEQHRTSITLRVPWQKDGAQEWRTFYYQVPVTDMQMLLPNHSYTVNLKVNMLGSLVPETPVEADELSYQIVDWGEENIDVDIKDYRYLVVSPTVYTANNEEEFTIPFYTSHPAEIADISMEYQRFNYYSDGNGDVVSFTISENVIKASNTATDSLCSYNVVKDPLGNQMMVRIKHPLKVWTPRNSSGSEVSLTGRNKNSSSDSPTSIQQSIVRYTPTTENAYSAYTIRFRIRHKDKPEYYEDVTVIQYPAIYIDPRRNPGGGANNKGNVFVNNSNSTYANYGGVHGLTSDDNANPNMYIINVSTLDAESGYLIGDPRTVYYNNDLSTYSNRNYPDLPTPTTNGSASIWSSSAPALYDGNSNRVLKYYYPTIESQDNIYKMRIAPKFRVASSYGVTNDLNRDNARRRMATYQETNCPAGRWRLPTYGELQFIISLSSTGKIPVLFSIRSSYWTAQGKCTINRDGTITLDTSTTGTAYVRGVYDEWYWENETDYVLKPGTNGNYTYTLGDMPRDAAKGN